MSVATGRPRRGIPARTGSMPGRLPTFLVIGAMKAGTDSLWQYLRAHPHVHMSGTKELDFFVSELNLRRGEAWYRGQFATTPPHAIAVGEASTSYSKYPFYDGVAERIQERVPGVRIVYLVRDPIERIRSHWQHQVLLRLEQRPLARAVLDDPAYVDFSSYAMQIERYLRWLPPERLLVVASESLRHDRAATMARILRFLGVDEPMPGGALDAEYHATAGGSVPRKGLALARAMPGYAMLARHAPAALRSATAAIRTRTIDPSVAAATLPRDVRDELIGRLAPDMAGLKALVGLDGEASGWLTPLPGG